jgi:hypothetical protein
MMKFRQIPPVGRAIIVVVGVGVFVIALVACWTSYNAIYRLVGQLGLYGTQTTSVFPLLLDAAFLVAELAAILGGIMQTVTRSDEVSPGWPIITMLLCGIGTIAFNVAHAYLLADDPLRRWRCVVAALPPVLMILSFQVLIAIVKWTMLHMGRPLRTGALFDTPQMYPEMETPSVSEQRTSQIDQGGQPRGWKGERTREYLASLNRGELASMTRAQLANDMDILGVPIEETYAGTILGKYRTNGSHR